MSAADIDKGARWSDEVARELEQADFGISCLTPENLSEPWLLFEAGALSKKKESARVCTYLWSLYAAKVPQPLAQFQAAKCDQEDTKRLLQSINQAMKNGLRVEQLAGSFDVWWPRLAERLSSIPAQAPQEVPLRTTDSMIEELLDTVRNLTNSMGELKALTAAALPKPLDRLSRDLITRNLAHSELWKDAIIKQIEEDERFGSRSEKPEPVKDAQPSAAPPRAKPG
jgi:hypothetical protein